MAPKRGQKRKTAAAAAAAAANGTSAVLAPPDCTTFSGWVEVESEPAFFNAMLKDMDARGIRIQEVLSMDQNMLAALPQPVHGFIFLFKYRTEDEEDHGQTGEGTDHIWFANQVPDGACATIAILNIVNNIPGLDMGKELRDFKHFTQTMSPLDKGQMIDDFDFVRRIHNSFARESDFLNADVYMKGKFDKFKRKEAAAKGRATKEAKEAARAALKDTAPIIQKKRKIPARGKEVAEKDAYATSTKSTPPRSTSPLSTPARSTALTRSTRSSARSTPNPGHDGDAEYDPIDRKSSRKQQDSVATGGLRRSARAPKPRKDTNAEQAVEDAYEAGYHFIAYMPIGDHVWKLDGLNYFPIDMGSFGVGQNGADGGTGNWIDVVSPTLMSRMLNLQDGSIDFSLMAVVQNHVVRETEDLLANVKAIQTLNTKLSGIVEDWREMEGAETKKEVVVGPSLDFGISQDDIDVTALSEDNEKEIMVDDDLLRLIKLRQHIISQQACLRANLRDSLEPLRKEDEQARHARHDYGTFIKSWLGSLAENGFLTDLINDA